MHNILALILLFAHNGLVGSVTLGITDTVAHCHKANAAAIAQHQKDLPPGVQAFGLCIDTTPFAGALKQAPQTVPQLHDPVNPTNPQTSQQTAQL